MRLKINVRRREELAHAGFSGPELPVPAAFAIPGCGRRAGCLGRVTAQTGG